jgi:hypothetical protein
MVRVPRGKDSSGFERDEIKPLSLRRSKEVSVGERGWGEG